MEPPGVGVGVLAAAEKRAADQAGWRVVRGKGHDARRDALRRS